MGKKYALREFSPVCRILPTHEDEEVEAVGRGVADRVVLLYLPPDSPWLHPLELLWRPFRREVTHGELFETIHAVITAAQDVFQRYHPCPQQVRSIIGAIPKHLAVCT